MVNAGLLSKGTTLSYIENGNVKTIAGVRSIPTVGNDPEKVDVTNLGSSKKRYAKGLQDTDNLEFSVIYKGENFKDIHRLVELDKPLKWLVMYPDGMTVHFTGEVMLKIDGVEVNAAVGFSIVIVVSDGPNIEFAKEPQRPTELKASNIQFDQFDLSWSGSGLFRVYVDRQKVGETYNNTFVIKGLKPSTKHIVSVASANGINEVHAVPITVTTTALPKITKINVPQRLDLYVDETKQLDVSTVPGEAMRAYEHVNKAVLDNSIVKFDGDKVSGVKSVNDENLGRNYVLKSGNAEPYGANDSKVTVYKNEEIKEFYIKGAMRVKTDGGSGFYKWYCRWDISEKAKDNSKLLLQFYVKNLIGKRVTLVLFDLKTGIKEFFIEGNEAKKITLELTDSMIDNHLRIGLKFSSDIDINSETDLLISNLVLSTKDTEFVWTPAPEDGYSYTSANVTFNDAEKSSAEFDIFVHERKRMTSPTESDTASFIL